MNYSSKENIQITDSEGSSYLITFSSASVSVINCCNSSISIMDSYEENVHHSKPTPSLFCLPLGINTDYQSMVEQFYTFSPIVFPILSVFLDVVRPFVRIVEHYQVKTTTKISNHSFALSLSTLLLLLPSSDASVQKSHSNLYYILKHSSSSSYFFFRLLNDKNITHESNKSPNEKHNSNNCIDNLNLESIGKTKGKKPSSLRATNIRMISIPCKASTRFGVCVSRM